MNKFFRRLQLTGSTIFLALALGVIVALAGYLLYHVACVYDGRMLICQHRYGGWIVFVGSVAITWLWIARQLAEKLRRRLRRGMYATGGGGRLLEAVTRLETVAHLVIEGEMPRTWAEGRQHPAMYHDGQGWWVWTPIEDGTRVWVGRQTMYEWLLDVVASEPGLGPGESAIAQRRWEPLIGRYQWDARCRLLEEVGATSYTTENRNSRRLARRDVTGILEDLEDALGIESQ